MNVLKFFVPALAVFAMSSAFAANPGDVIVVSGLGQVAVEPNVAFVEAAVVTEAKEVREAQASNAKAYNAAVSALRAKFGLSEKEVQSGSYNIQPKYESNPQGKTSIVGYTVRHSLQVKVLKLADLGSVVDYLGTAGVNQLSQIRFSHTDKRAFEMKALELAMADSRVKADVIARSAGRGIVRITRADYQSIEAPEHVVRAAAMDSVGGAPPSATDLTPADLIVRATVSVQYEF